MKSSSGRWIWGASDGRIIESAWAGGDRGTFAYNEARTAAHTLLPTVATNPSPQCHMLSATVTYTNISENAAVGRRRRLEVCRRRPVPGLHLQLHLYTVRNL